MTEPDVIGAHDVRAACEALRMTTPLPHQAYAIARMLDIFIYHRLTLQASGPGVDRLSRALVSEPARGFLLTDGMGMGKTFQAIATAVLLLVCEFPSAAPVYSSVPPTQERILVVLNNALISTWCEQIARHWRDVDMKRDIFVYSGRDRFARLMRARARFVFSTYETLRADAQADEDGIFHQVSWRLIVFDEVHKARNGRRNTSSSTSSGSALWRTLRRFPEGVCKLGLTGTPVCNHMMELCSIAQVVFKGHSVLSSEDFWSGYERHFTRGVLSLLRGSILLRRTLASEGIELPPRTDSDIPIVLAADEKVSYKLMHDRMESALKEWVDAMERHAPPFVLKQARDRYASSVNLLGLTTCGATKQNEVVRICRDIGVGAGGERIVIVSRFVRVLESLQAVLVPPPLSLRVALFTGALDWRARGAVVDAFRAHDIDVVLLSTMAGNEGVDFSCAQHLLLVDSASAPNPMTHEDQVVARIYRIGQTKPSFIWRLIAVSTIDDAFAFELHAQKRANAAALLDMQHDDDEDGQVFCSVTSTADLLRRAVCQLDS